MAGDSKSLSPDSWSEEAIFKYIVAILVIALAFLLRWVLDPAPAAQLPFIFCLPSALLVARWCGFGPAALALFAGAALADVYFLPDASMFLPGTWPEAIIFISYFGMGAAGIWLIGKWRLVEQRVSTSETRNKMLESAIEKEEHNQRALKQSEAEFRLLFNDNPEPMLVYDRDTLKILAANDAAARQYGFSQGELQQISIERIWPRQEIETAARRGNTVKSLGVATHRRKDGSEFPAELMVEDITFRGRPGRLGIAHDVTEREQGEKALLESVERLDLAQRGANVAVFEWDIANGTMNGSQELETVYGAPAGTFTGKLADIEKWLSCIHPADRHQAEFGLRNALVGGDWREDFRVIRLDGATRWLHGRAKVFLDKSGHPIRMLGVKLDITERKEAELALARQTERAEVLSEAASFLLYANDPSQMVSRIFQKLSTHVQADVYFNFLCVSDTDMVLHSFSGVPPEAARDLSHLKVGQAVCGRVAETRRSMYVPAVQTNQDSAVHLIQQLGIRAYACNPLLIGDRLMGTLSFGSRSRQKFDADELELFATLTSYIAVGLDRLRLLKEKDERAHELETSVQVRTADLQHSLESLESVLYHVAHDLRAPLRAMHGFTQLLLQNYTPSLDAEGKEYARRITEASQKMDLLIADLLAYGRAAHQQVVSKPVDLNEMTQHVLDRLRENVQARKAHIEIKSPLPVVSADPELLEQALFNLTTNALTYSKAETAPVIRIWASHEAGKVRLCLEDEGTGIQPDDQQRIFKLFERLPQSGEVQPGTGMGLAIVQKCMERLRGRVAVASEPGRGTCFSLELPNAQLHPGHGP